LVECTEITAARAGEVFSTGALSEAVTSRNWPPCSKLKLSSEAALKLLSGNMPLKLELLLSGLTEEECKLLSGGAAVRSSLGGLWSASTRSVDSSSSLAAPLLSGSGEDFERLRGTLLAPSPSSVSVGSSAR